MTNQSTYLDDDSVLNGASPNSSSEAGPANDGRVAPLDGNVPVQPSTLHQALTQGELGPNFEHLEELGPSLVNALRELASEYKAEGMVARRHEIRRIRQARLFWQGLQYAWWNPQDMTWNLPYESKLYDDSSISEMPRYQFVTNIYQAFGLSFISVLSQDVPATRFYPQSAQSIVDITTAKAASKVSELVEQNNRVQNLLTGVAFYLWTDGKIGGYVRYIADGQRFGFHNEPVIDEHFVALGEDAYVCPECGAEQGVGEGSAARLRQNAATAGGPADGSNGFEGTSANEKSPASEEAGYSNGGAGSSGYSGAGNYGGESGANSVGSGTSLLPPVICKGCGGALGPENYLPAPRVAIPVVTGTRAVANGQEVISVIGGLELNTPVWANEMHEYPYLQWSMEVHRAKLKASYPHAADKIQTGGPQSSDDVYARATRVAVSQGLPVTAPGDTLFNLITFSRTWIRPWAFYSIEDKTVRDALLALFPNGCYVAFAGDTYCEARNESMDDCWRVMHALPGDGQNRPSVGDSLVQIQERYNTLSNIQAETYEYGIPPIYADPQVLDFDALSNQTAEPAAHYPARARPGQPLAAGFFQPAPAQVPPDLVRHQEELMGPVAQFLTGLFPAVFGGEMESQKTASGYAMARDQAMGRLGLVWRRLKQFYSDVMLLSVDCFRKNRPEDAEIPVLGPGGEYESTWIRLADLKGNIQAYPEGDETFPRLKSQQRAVIQQLMASSDPLIQQALSDPANVGFVKSVLGLTDMVVPGEDSRNKQLREIDLLLKSGPIVVEAAKELGPEAGRQVQGKSPASNRSVALRASEAGYNEGHSNGNGNVQMLSTVPVDLLFDEHTVELEECRRWANSDAGQIAHAENPAGFANVRAHAEAHMRAIAMATVAAQSTPVVRETGAVSAKP